MTNKDRKPEIQKNALHAIELQRVTVKKLATELSYQKSILRSLIAMNDFIELEVTTEQSL